MSIEESTWGEIEDLAWRTDYANADLAQRPFSPDGLHVVETHWTSGDITRDRFAAYLSARMKARQLSCCSGVVRIVIHDGHGVVQNTIAKPFNRWLSHTDRAVEADSHEMSRILKN